MSFYKYTDLYYLILYIYITKIHITTKDKYKRISSQSVDLYLHLFLSKCIQVRQNNYNMKIAKANDSEFE